MLVALGSPPPVAVTITVGDHHGFELPYAAVTIGEGGETGRALVGRTNSRGAVRLFVVPGRTYSIVTNLGGFANVAVNGPTTVDLRTEKRPEPLGIF
jgi:hypothetical protein